MKTVYRMNCDLSCRSYPVTYQDAQKDRQKQIVQQIFRRIQGKRQVDILILRKTKR